MYVAIARVTLSIPDAGSLKSKRHVVRKVLDKVRARFNVSIAEVGDNDLWQKATIGVSAVANDHQFAQESIDKVLRYIEEMYVAPVTSRQTEIIPVGGDLYGHGHGQGDEDFTVHLGGAQRSLAEAEAEASRSGTRTLAEVEYERAPPEERHGGRKGKSQRHAHPAERADRTAGRHAVPMTEEERERAIDELRRRMKGGRDRGRDDDED